MLGQIRRNTFLTVVFPGTVGLVSHAYAILSIWGDVEQDFLPSLPYVLTERVDILDPPNIINISTFSTFNRLQTPVSPAFAVQNRGRWKHIALQEYLIVPRALPKTSLTSLEFLKKCRFLRGPLLLCAYSLKGN